MGILMEYDGFYSLTNLPFHYNLLIQTVEPKGM